MLRRSGVPFTSVRPVYIYGPLNYNPVEEWFFHRIKARRPIPVPGSGMQVHIADSWLPCAVFGLPLIREWGLWAATGQLVEDWGVACVRLPV